MVAGGDATRATGMARHTDRAPEGRQMVAGGDAQQATGLPGTRIAPRRGAGTMPSARRGPISGARAAAAVLGDTISLV